MKSVAIAGTTAIAIATAIAGQYAWFESKIYLLEQCQSIKANIYNVTLLLVSSLHFFIRIFFCHSSLLQPNVQ